MRLTQDLVRNKRMTSLTETAPSEPLSGGEFKGLAYDLQQSCLQCALDSKQPSDHLQTALFHFTRAVFQHHAGVHEVARRAFNSAHAELQHHAAGYPS